MISQNILPHEQSKSPPAPTNYFTPLPPLPKHLERYLDCEFSKEKSIDLDRWLWYCQQEFEGAVMSVTSLAMPAADYAYEHLKEAHHKEWTKDSGVGETITELNLKSVVAPVEIAKLLNWQKYHGSLGWYFRSCDPMTGKLTDKGQFKPDIPIQFPDSDKPQKYFSFPKGSESEIICLLLALNDWIKTRVTQLNQR